MQNTLDNSFANILYLQLHTCGTRKANSALPMVAFLFPPFATGKTLSKDVQYTERRTWKGKRLLLILLIGSILLPPSLSNLFSKRFVQSAVTLEREERKMTGGRDETKFWIETLAVRQTQILCLFANHAFVISLCGCWADQF